MSVHCGQPAPNRGHPRDEHNQPLKRFKIDVEVKFVHPPNGSGGVAMCIPTASSAGLPSQHLQPLRVQARQALARECLVDLALCVKDEWSAPAPTVRRAEGDSHDASLFGGGGNVAITISSHWRLPEIQAKSATW
jgi:hypothetical protein